MIGGALTAAVSFFDEIYIPARVVRVERDPVEIWFDRYGFPDPFRDRFGARSFAECSWNPFAPVELRAVKVRAAPQLVHRDLKPPNYTRAWTPRAFRREHVSGGSWRRGRAWS